MDEHHLRAEELRDDSEDHHGLTLLLHRLLDAFPSVPLELIASAVSQAHGDPDVAAEILSSNLLHSVPSSSSSATDEEILPPKTHEDRDSAVPKGLHLTEPIRSGTCSHKGRRQSCLQDFFPSSPPKNAWSRCATALNKNVPATTCAKQSTYPEQEIDSSIEFPSLGGSKSISTSAQIPRSKPICTSKKLSAACGLVSNVRRHHKKLLRKHPCPNENIEENNMNSFMPVTESEDILISKLGDGFKLGIGAVRDVLAYYHGDVAKSMEVLLQMGPSADSALDIETELLSTSSGSSSSQLTASKDQNHGTQGGNSNENLMHRDNDHNVFEEAILKQEDSSMKWVMDQLCKEYPLADKGILLEILRASNFSYNDAEKILQDDHLKEDVLDCKESIESHELSNMILKSLFINQEDDQVEEKKKPPRRSDNATDKCLKQSEHPNWKVIASAELDIMELQMENKSLEWDALSFPNATSEGYEADSNEGKSYGDWDDYDRHHTSSKQQWKTTMHYFKAAERAYAEGDVTKAQALTEKGNMYKQLSSEAKERANKYGLQLKSQREGDFILDLQDHRTSEALKLLRLHLKSLSCIPSYSTFTIITGSQDKYSQSLKLKDKVLKYLEEKEYKWTETGLFHIEVELKVENMADQ